MGCGSTRASSSSAADAVDPPYGPSTNGKHQHSKNGVAKKKNTTNVMTTAPRMRNSVDDAELLPGSVPDTEQSETMPPPVSFDIPVDSLIKKHPPKRFQKLEDQQLQVSPSVLQEKQMSAEERRQKVLQERIQSSRRSANPANRRLLMAPPKDLGITEQIEHEKSAGSVHAVENSLDYF